MDATYPDFLSCDIRYYWPREMVEHKGGRYPKPVEVREVVNGKQYYIADPSSRKLFRRAFGAESSFHACARSFPLERGLVHETKEAAIQHAKVMLGVSDEQ